MSTKAASPVVVEPVGVRPRRARSRVSVVAPSHLDRGDRAAMFRLFSDYYERVDRNSFTADLEAKDEVIVLRHGDEIIGFSTVKYFDIEVEGRRVRTIYSGDTVVDRNHWGRGALQWGFTRVMFSQWIRNPLRPVYWFLISKGYKTYLLLTNNFAEHYPRHERPTPQPIQQMIDAMSDSLFGDFHQRETGLIDFGESRGQLRCDVANPSASERATVETIAYFVRRNPSWKRGTELPCVGRVRPMVSVQYAWKRIRRIFGGHGGKRA